MDQVKIERLRAATDELRLLIDELDSAMAEHYTAEQRHGLSLDALFEPHVRFFIARVDGAAVGCGGVAIFDSYAEMKRMYVRPNARGSGVAQAVLARIDAEARDAGLETLRLETGDRQFAALRVYKRAGFVRCGAFGDYAKMPAHAIATSIFMEKRLA